MTGALPVCSSCQVGRHHHDTIPGTGEDGGCPMAADPHGPGNQRCYCPVVLPTRAVAPRHCPTCRCGT